MRRCANAAEVVFAPRETMQNQAWVAFLRHLPRTLQEGLAVKTLGGTEVSIQYILRVDHEFFAFKGRLAGTQDAGRVFFVPYGKIDHLYYQKEVGEEEFKAGFDSLTMPACDSATVAPPPPPPEPAEPPPVELEPQLPPVDRATPVPIKSAVLERFRSRSSSNAVTTMVRPSLEPREQDSSFADG